MICQMPVLNNGKGRHASYNSSYQEHHSVQVCKRAKPFVGSFLIHSSHCCMEQHVCLWLLTVI